MTELDLACFQKVDEGTRLWNIYQALLGNVTNSILTSVGTLQRPNDTTAYTAGDAISDSTTAPTPISFAGVIPEEGTQRLVMHAILESDQAALAATIELHLFKSSVTPTNDNAAFNLSYANSAERLGVISFYDWFNDGGVARSQSAVDITPPVYATTGTTVYGMLKAVGAFTPAAEQNFRATLNVISA